MPEIVLQHVTQSFASHRGATTVVLSDINLRIEAGEIACLVGPSGCGKTTLLNLMAGFQSPTRGEVRIGGQVVAGPGADRVVIFQDVRGSLMPWWTARQNAEFGLRLLRRGGSAQRRELARQYLSLVGLREAEEKYPEEMSGGMQQRVQIARALVTNPVVLLMDEPFGALDFLTRARLQQLLQDLHLRRPTTTAFVTHDIGEAAILGDSIWVMDGRGGILEKVSIAAPRPRSMITPAVVAAVDRLMRLVMPEQAASSGTLPPVLRASNPQG